MNTLELLTDPDRASILLDDTRLALVRELVEPDSAAGVARRLDLPRQRVNYHLRELEKAGFLELVEERRKGNCTERRLRSTAGAYLVSPAAMNGLAPEPADHPDRFSPVRLIALAARLLRDLGSSLARRSDEPEPTLAIEAEVRLARPADRRAFAEDLALEVARLAREYDDPSGRRVRILAGAYDDPVPSEATSP